MEDIVEAKVLLSEEEPSPLLKRHVPRTASVRVRVRGNRTLSKVEVQGIVSFVASGVKGLDHEKVSITDARGRSYNTNEDTGAADKLEMTWKAERHFADKIENLLLEFIPRVKATVSLSLDLQKHRREIKDYQHEALNNGALSVLVTNQSEKEDSTSKEGSQGVVGAGTNSEAQIKEGDGSNEMKMGKSKKMENFDNSLVQEFIEFDGLSMQVSGVSVVVVNKKMNAMFDDDPSQKPYEEWDWLDKAKLQGASIEELVAAAIGLKTPEMVKVTQQHMDMPELPAEPTMVETYMSFFDGYLVLMILLSLIGGYMLISMIRKAQPEEELLEMPEYDEEEKKDELPPLKEPELDPGIRQVNSRVKEIIEEDPLKAASLIRHWMSSE
jgi:flagellar biosynthesis/type III secretory pathway M-ring protein FliF/YscJ